VLIRMAASDYLQECGFKVLEASSAAEAIAMIQGSETPIDVVFSDIRMPGEMDGFGLAKWIREHRAGLSVLLTSGDAKTAEVAKGLCEKLEIVSKPYDYRLAAARIRQLISAKTHGTNAAGFGDVRPRIWVASRGATAPLLGLQPVAPVIFRVGFRELRAEKE
jgi:DNA-binding response OmpR family regulator